MVSRYQRERLNASADEQMVARMIMKEATGEDALLKKPERRKQFRQAYGAAGDPRYLSGRPVLRRMETLEDLAEALAEQARFMRIRRRQRGLRRRPKAQRCRAGGEQEEEERRVGCQGTNGLQKVEGTRTPEPQEMGDGVHRPSLFRSRTCCEEQGRREYQERGETCRASRAHARQGAHAAATAAREAR